MEQIRRGEERTMRGLRSGLIHGILVGVLLLASCTDQTRGSDDGGGRGGMAEMAPSKLVAPLSGAYEVKPNGVRVPPKEEELPVPLGSVEAHWYRSGGVYVIAFGGLDLDETGPLCPGSSIQTDAGFEHVTNSPTRGKACEGARNLAAPEGGVRTCGPLVLYITAIPDDTKGDLFASLELYASKGRIVGVTGVVAADRSAAPEIDPQASAYSLPKGLVAGMAEVTC
jgi:hypothetical protein